MAYRLLNYTTGNFVEAVMEGTGQHTGTAAIVALAAAIFGVILVIAGNPGWALVLEVSASVLGAAGFFLAASPRVSGGVLSIVAIVIAVFGIGLSVLGVIGSAIF